MKRNIKDIPLNIGLRGEYELKVIDTLTGKIKKETTNKNMVLDECLSYIFSHPGANLIDTSFDDRRMFGSTEQRVGCHAGSGSNPTTPDMTQLQNRISTVECSSGISNTTTNPFFMERFFVFPAGNFIGTLRELGLGQRYAIGSYLWTRVVIDPEIEITATDELRVTWRFFVDLGESRIWSGTIEGGQRDGSDINWKLFISDAQLVNFLTNGLGNNQAVSGISGMFANRPNAPAFRLGSSNTDSLSTTWNVMGNLLHQGGPNSTLKTIGVSWLGDPPNRSMTRSFRVGFEHNSPNNVQVGEMVVFRNITSYSSGGSLFRVTFDPPLDKAEFNRLFIRYRLTLSRI